MARIPDVNALGGRAAPRSGRGVASISPGAAAAPGIALARLGDTLAGIGDRASAQEDNLEVATARAKLLRADLEARREAEAMPDYTAWASVYEKRMTEARETISAGIRGSRGRELFGLDVDTTLARGQDRLLGMARDKEVSAGRASLATMIDDQVDLALGVEDAQTRDAVLRNLHDAVDASVGRGYLTPEEAVVQRRRIAEGYARRRLDMLPPAARLASLTGQDVETLGDVGPAIAAAPATPDEKETLRRVAMLESRGDAGAVNPRSGAAGAFQFMPATARQYGLADPHDVTASTNAALRLMRDNGLVLSQVLGRQPQPWELYLAHQQGAAGAAALLARPNESAVRVLTDVYEGNADMARKAVTWNGGRDRMTAGQFAQLWQTKFEAAKAPVVTAEAGLTRYLPPDEISKATERATREVDQERALDERKYRSEFGGFVDAVASGADIAPQAAAMFSDAVLNAKIADPAVRRLMQGQRDDAMLSADLTRRLSGATPNEIAAMSEEVASRADGQVYDVAGMALAPNRARLQSAFASAVTADIAARRNDPAAYALRSQFVAGMADLAERPGGVLAYAEATLAEQDRLGIRNPKVLTEAQAKELAAKINETPAAEVGQQYRTILESYGPHAGNVREHLEKAGVDPSYHIAGLYAENPAASQAIAAVAGLKREDLAASLGQSVASVTRIALATKMDEFRRAFTAGDFSGAAARQFTALFSVAEKMVLADVQRNGDPANAVERTATKLIDDIYEVFNTSDIRAYVPRRVGNVAIDMVAVEDTADAMLDPERLAAFGPAMVGPEGVAAEARAMQAARNGMWITNDNADGLVLVTDMGDGTTLPIVNARGEPYGFRFTEVAR